MTNASTITLRINADETSEDFVSMDIMFSEGGEPVRIGGIIRDRNPSRPSDALWMAFSADLSDVGGFDNKSGIESARALARYVGLPA